LSPFILGFAAITGITDVTVSMAPGATVIAGTTGVTPYSLALAAVDASSSLRIFRPRTSFVFDLSGHYGQPLIVVGVNNPPRDISGRARGRFNIVTSPRTNLILFTEGFVSSRLGLRASDELAVRDPFSVNRVLDGLSIQNSFSGRPSARSNIRVDFRYAQNGAIWADLPTAVGIDTHAFLGTAAASFQFTRRFSAGPVARLSFTHFNHALLDTDFHRGPAEVTALSTLGFARYELTGKTRASVIAGVTIASAPPGAKDIRAIASPDVRIELRTLGRRIAGMGALSFGYQSIGPRIGFGLDYAALLDVWIRPFTGRNYRDVLLHGVLRSRWAKALLPMGQGNVTTTAWAAGTTISAPLRLGWQINAGVDLEFVSMDVDPRPSRGDPQTAFRTLFTLALAATVSTDRGQLLPGDPLAPPGDERRPVLMRAVRRDPTRVPAEGLGESDEGNDD
jgi:hypothetical protein